MADKKKDNDDVGFIQALAQLLGDNDLAEIKVKREYADNDCLKVRVSRYAPQIAQAAPVQVAPAMAAPIAAPAAPAPAASSPEASAPAAAPIDAVTSPMVGTVYLSAEPGADPFVAEGTVVKEGQTLLIIEAMKTMNQIPAPKSGKITSILVSDGQAVEFGAPLVVIE